MDLLAFLAGLALVLGTWWSVTRTLIVPRGLSSRLTAGVDRVVRWSFTTVADRFDRLETRDRILVSQGPAMLVALLAMWIALFFLGFALLMYAAGPFTFPEALRQSGSSIFTLGYALPPGVRSVEVSFLAAATGLFVVALQISYLPTLYGAFNRREMLVTLLQSRAGVPSWGPELLARHQLVDILDNLPDFYAEWERWAADVAESHTNYPALVYFRSPSALRSWVVGLLAVLDSAALYLALAPQRAPSEARLCLRMGFVSLREVCRTIGIPYDDDPHPDAPLMLTYDDFLLGVARLERVGFPMERSAEDAWPHFHGWRVNYEPLCYALAELVDAVPAMWSGPRRSGAAQLLPIRPPDRRPAST